MAKQLLIVLVIAAAVGGGYFFLNYEIQRQPVDGEPAVGRSCPRAPPADRRPIRPRDQFAPPFCIASFQLGRLDETKLANQRVNDVLVRLLPRFDLIALQGVRGKNQGVLIRLVEQLNAASGRTYDFATCPTQQRDALEHYSAFVFDRGRIDVDRTTVHFVEDRLGRFRIKPLVGSFRVHGPDPAEAFTFTLINVETDPDHAAAELDLLAEAFRAVRDNWPRAKTTSFCWATWKATISTWAIGQAAGRHAALSGVPSTARGRQSAGQHPAGSPGHREFTGPGGSCGHDAGVRPDHARGAGSLRAPADLGRVQRVRRRPGRTSEVR